MSECMELIWAVVGSKTIYNFIDLCSSGTDSPAVNCSFLLIVALEFKGDIYKLHFNQLYLINNELNIWLLIILQ